MGIWSGAISLTSTPAAQPASSKGSDRPQTCATCQYSRVKHVTNKQHIPSSHEKSSRALSRSPQVQQARMQGHTSSRTVGCILASGSASEGKSRGFFDRHRIFQVAAIFDVLLAPVKAIMKEERAI